MDVFTPLAQYAVQVVRHDRMVEARAAHRRRLARDAERVTTRTPHTRSGPRTSTSTAAANA
jgi:hypothetical protein